LKVKNIKNKKTNSQKVFVGLSGGVDSAVSAALLQKEGFEVTGVFIKAWTPEGYPCTWKEDRRSAMRVAAILDIPFITLDLEKEYKKEVVDYMIAEYKIGRTPNPDVMCNKEIKFGHFLKFALKNGADFVATGHYACKKVVSSKHLASSKNKKTNLEPWLLATNYWLLKEGADPNKDQSYFLWTLNQDQLKHVLFPIGHLQKSEVRKLAGKFGLPQETRKDSQGLCFLGKVDMKEFLSRYMPQKEGKVLNEKGEIIGFHNGALFFTIGERHGFTILQKTAQGSPVYVIAKDIKKNTITVAEKFRSTSDTPQKVILTDVNLSGEIPNKKIQCRVRYRQEKIACRISKENNQISVTFDKPQNGVAPGQSLVLYLPAGKAGDGETCLGGGIIK
jgi:tRNA-specific 2-thiouridylase